MFSLYLNISFRFISIVLHACIKENCFCNCFIRFNTTMKYFYLNRRTFASSEWTSARSICLLGSIVMISKESISLLFYHTVSNCAVYSCSYLSLIIIGRFHVDSYSGLISIHRYASRLAPRAGKDVKIWHFIFYFHGGWGGMV